MTSNLLSSVDVFGFHTRFTYPNKEYSEEVEQSNGRICAGYVPLLGIVVGLIRLHEISTPPRYASPARIAYTVRAIFEIMGLGLLLLPLDVVATVVRMLGAYVIR
jgi:hypothetical protein